VTPCFVCGSESTCAHREPELVVWEGSIRERLESLQNAKNDPSGAIARLVIPLPGPLPGEKP
jgi:hypothetical protein